MPRAFVGIDLGTTFTGVVVNSRGDMQVVRDPTTGLAKFPTAVYFSDTSGVMVGAPAISEAGLDGRLEFLATQFKRSIGTAAEFHVAASRNLSAEHLSAEILRRCHAMALERLPGIVNEDISWTVSIPARFGEPAKAATVRAAVAAGLPQQRLTLVLEPEAAAITAYLNRRIDLANNDHVILFDFGGGTLDIVIMQKVTNGLDPILVDGGDPHLGGIDLDLALAKHVASRLAASQSSVSASIDEWTPADRFQLLRQVEAAKRSICGSRGAGGAPRSRLLVSHQGTTFTPTVDASDLVTASAPLFKAAREALERTLSLAWDRRGLDRADIRWVLLTGGSSQILGLTDLIKQVVGEQVIVAMPDDPWESIARGACVFAEDPTIILSKISGESYGVSSSRDARPGDPQDRLFRTSWGALKCRQNSLFFLRGQKVPREGIVHTYWSVEDDQNAIAFKVLRGDADDPSECEAIGSLTLRIPPVPHGYSIKCSFRIDDGNRLRVAAWDPGRNERVECYVGWSPAPLVSPNG